MIIKSVETAFYRFDRGSMEFAVNETEEGLTIIVDVGQGQHRLVMTYGEAAELGAYLKRNFGT